MRKIIYVILVTFAFAGSLSNLSLSCSPTTVRQSSAYTIGFCTASTTPSTSTVKITFPSQFTISDSSSYSCSATSFAGSTSTVTCSVSSNVVTVNNLFASGSIAANYIFPFSIILPNIVNPQSTTVTSSIQLSTVSSSGSIIDSALSSSSLTVSATPAYFSAASISPQSDIIGAQST